MIERRRDVPEGDQSYTVNDRCTAAHLSETIQTKQSDPGHLLKRLRIVSEAFFHDGAYLGIDDRRNCGPADSDRGVDPIIALAKVQQYLEFMLTDQQQADGVRVAANLTKGESVRFVPKNPFNPGWWGWQDDDVPACPGERDFKDGFINWSKMVELSPDEIDAVLHHCRPSDGPTQQERAEAEALRWLRERGLAR